MPRMAMPENSRLDAGVEQHMRDFSSTLSEKDRRRFAAIEARQFGRGGITYVDFTRVGLRLRYQPQRVSRVLI